MLRGLLALVLLVFAVPAAAEDAWPEGSVMKTAQFAIEAAPITTLTNDEIELAGNGASGGANITVDNWTRFVHMVPAPKAAILREICFTVGGFGTWNSNDLIGFQAFYWIDEASVVSDINAGSHNIPALQIFLNTVTHTPPGVLDMDLVTLGDTYCVSANFVLPSRFGGFGIHVTAAPIDADASTSLAAIFTIKYEVWE